MTTVTYRGYKTTVLVADETAYGTAPAIGDIATAIQGKISTVSITKTNNLIRTLGLGEGRNETFHGFGNFEGTWSMEYELASFDFLRYGIGARTGDGEVATPWVLIEKDFMDYTAGVAAGMKSFAMVVSSDGATKDTELLSGCVMNTIGLALNVGETVKCSLEGFFKTPKSSTSSPAATSPDTTKPWIFAQGTFNWNSSPIARVTSATVNINNNFDPDIAREIGSRFVQAAEPGRRTYDWVLTVKMTNTVATSLRDHFYGKAGEPETGVGDAEPSQYAIDFSFSEGAVTGDRNAKILLKNCSINDISKPISIGENIVELTINGIAKSGADESTNQSPFKYWVVEA